MLIDAVERMSELIKVDDPRQSAKVKYPLVPTLFAIILAWIAGATSAVKVELFWSEHFEKLKRHIPGFPDEMISHDTVNRLLSLIMVDDLKGLMAHFSQLVLKNSVNGETDIKRILSLDGQTPKAAEYEPKEGSLGLSNDDRRLLNRLYYVSIYDSTAGLTLAMEEVESKENENKACVRAIEMFDLEGTIVTADALNTQRSVAEAIIRKGGDYVLALKDNHKTLKKGVQEAISNPLLVEMHGESYSTDVELGHGRIETRTVIALPASVIPNRQAIRDWKKDTSTVFYAVTESFNKKHNVRREPEVRYFLSSLSIDNPDIAKLGYRAIREHWNIENQLHWCLDMDFGQDHMQIKNRNYLRNCELLSRLALNIARQLQPVLRRKTRQDLPSISSVMSAIYMAPEKHLLKIANLFAYGKL
jgi:predicted transposase YbfD/YdcC